MNKNDKITGVCQGYTQEGFGVVKVDEFPLFVKGILKDETGELTITMVKKSYGFAKVDKILKASPFRNEPPCPIAKQCGGCQLQHMEYAEQLRYKKQHVQDVISRIGKLDIEVNDVIGASSPFAYRNKAQIPVGVEHHMVRTGFYRIHSNTIIDTDRCLIQSDKINEVLQVMRKMLTKYEGANVFRHLLIKHAFASGEVMVVWIVKARKFPHMQEMADELAQSLSFVKSIVMNMNKRNDNVILGDEEYVLYGNGYITDILHGLKFNISSKSFYQVNPVQTEVLYAKALEFADLTGNETVVDLYCGVGTISMFLAQKAKRVVGIEIVPQAIEDAKKNALMNDLENIEFICSDAATYAQHLVEHNYRADVVVIDPPRKGCDRETIESIVKMTPDRIVYVSCDPATLARDLALFDGYGYKTMVVQPVDMFPMSKHVECVVKLVRKK